MLRTSRIFFENCFQQGLNLFGDSEGSFRGLPRLLLAPWSSLKNADTLKLKISTCRKELEAKSAMQKGLDKSFVMNASVIYIVFQ